MTAEDLSGQPVDFEHLEFDDDLALLDGVPFSGTIVSAYQDGTLEFRGCYRDGLPAGLNEAWYPNGRIFRRWIAVRGLGSSESWAWYPDGTQRSYRKNDKKGVPVEMRAWDRTGAEIDPSTQLPDNRADVLAELFAQAIAPSRTDYNGETRPKGDW